LLREAGFGESGRGEEEQTEEPDHPHGEPPFAPATASFNPCGRSRRAECESV
jgi:hypothetical protein